MNQLTLRLKQYAQDEPEDYLVVEISVDGEPLTDFNDFATDLSALRESSERPGEYFILTGWCGDAGCAGLRRAIRVQHSANTILWQIVEPTPKRQLVFERTAYLTALQTCIKQGKRTLEYRRTTGTRPVIVVPSRNKTFFPSTQ
jgi:hypothetical protein